MLDFFDVSVLISRIKGQIELFLGILTHITIASAKLAQKGELARQRWGLMLVVSFHVPTEGAFLRMRQRALQSGTRYSAQARADQKQSHFIHRPLALEEG